MFQQLDGRADGHGVFDTHLGIFADKGIRPIAEVVAEALEQHRVNLVYVYFSVHRVAHAEALVPAFLARLAHFLQWIKGIDGERDFGQRGG